MSTDYWIPACAGMNGVGEGGCSRGEFTQAVDLCPPIGLNWRGLIVTGRSMRALRTFTVAAAVGLLALIGAAHQASAQIKIGAVLSVTGPASFLGDPEKRTLEIYVDEINAKGGVN